MLLGVLAAQAVADWAEDRRLWREAAAQYQQARDQAIDQARIMAYWADVGTCLIDRAREVARVAADGGTLPASSIGRPALPSARMPTWDEDVRRVAYVRYGKEKMDTIAGFEVGVMILTETSLRIRDGWSTFALLDPANGTPSDQDRANVRLAAISVMDHIRLMRANSPAADMKVLGVPPAEWKAYDPRPWEVDRCGLIVNWQPQ